MKVGDLVRHRDNMWRDWLGVVVRQIPGTDQTQVVYWSRGISCSYPKSSLQVVNASK